MLFEQTGDITRVQLFWPYYTTLLELLVRISTFDIL